MNDRLAVTQHPDEAPAAPPPPEKAPVVRRKLWDEETTRSRLGEEGYAWFVERAERGIARCPHCKGSGSVSARDSIGIRPGISVSCACEPCGANIGRLIDFTKAYFDTVPPAYRRFTLRTLEPYAASSVPTERQGNVIQTVNANPDKSYAFFGRPGAGKTVLSTALYSEMLFRQFMRPHPPWKWFPLRRMSVRNLLEQHADYATRRRNPEWTDLDSVINAPDVTVNKIVYVRRSGDVFRLFLEDMNGGDLNASSRAVLFEVINSLHENAGQFVITSNLAIPEFKRQYGEDLFWRIAHHCTVIDLSGETANR